MGTENEFPNHDNVLVNKTKDGTFNYSRWGFPGKEGSDPRKKHESEEKTAL